MRRQGITSSWLAAVAAGVLFAASPSASGQTGILSVDGQCPGEITARIDKGRFPGYLLIFGLLPGSTRIPHGYICSGTVLGIKGRLYVVTGVPVDENGVGMVTGFAPARACGHFLQALHAGVCETTNVVRIAG